MRISLVFIVAVFYLTLSNAYASEDSRKKLAEQKAQQAIDACWAISEEDRASGNTPRMRSGALDSVLCMERVFLKLISSYLFKDDPESLKSFENNIQNLRSSYGGLIWDLYNGHDGCSPSCGTMYHVFHNGAYAKLLEDVLKRTLAQVIEYDLQGDLLGADLLIDTPAQKVKEEVLKNIPLNNLSLCYAQISQSQCGNFSVRNVHDLFILEGVHHEPYNKLSEQNFLHFVSVKGFVKSAQKDTFSFFGTIETNNPNSLNERCSEYGDFSFIKQNADIWKLNTNETPCFEDKNIFIKTNKISELLQMPKKYLGYWRPYTKTLGGVGIDIRPDAIYHINDPDYYAIMDPSISGEVYAIERYKVIHIDETHVYMIREARFAKAWPEIIGTEECDLPENESYCIPLYEYVSFSIDSENRYSAFIDLHVSKTYECNLREADWNLPIEVHRQHILNNTCPDPSIALEKNAFRNLSYGYVRDKEPKEKN